MSAIYKIIDKKTFLQQISDEILNLHLQYKLITTIYDKYQQNNIMSLYYKLSILMGIIVVISNYLVQFPIQYFELSEILTYGAFSYPITFLITDLANRAYGKIVARKIVYIG